MKKERKKLRESQSDSFHCPILDCLYTQNFYFRPSISWGGIFSILLSFHLHTFSFSLHVFRSRSFYTQSLYGFREFGEKSEKSETESISHRNRKWSSRSMKLGLKEVEDDGVEDSSNEMWIFIIQEKNLLSIAVKNNGKVEKVY